MAIKGLTCRETRSVGAIAVLGTLRKGAPKGGNRPGADLTYFRFDTADQGLAAILQRLYGDKPGEGFENGIKFFFPSADFDQNMPTGMAGYKGGSCMVMCDRESISGERTKTGDWIQHSAHRRPECRYPACFDGPKGKESCGTSGKLRIVIPEFQRFGVVEVVVGAINDLEHVSKQVEEIQRRVAEHGGDLSKVPLILYRKARGISTPVVGKNYKRTGDRARREKSLIEVSIAPEFFNRSIAAREQFAIASASSFNGTAPMLMPVTEELNTDNFRDEFGTRPSMDFMRTAEWKDLKMKFEQSRSLAEVDVAAACGQSLIRDGKLAPTAKNQIEFAATAAQRRIEESGVVPIEPIEVEFEEEMSTADRFRAIGDRTGHTMAQIEAMANDLKFSEDVSTWDAKQCRTLRNRLYAKCDRAIKAFGSGESAAAEYQAFMDADLVDFLDDVAVWDAWSAIAA
jgi:hypothetical protein